MKSKAKKSRAAGADVPQADFATQTEESEEAADLVEHGGVTEQRTAEVNHCEIQTDQRKQTQPIPIPAMVDTVRSPATREQSPMGTAYDTREMPRESPIYEPAGARSGLSPCMRRPQRQNSPGHEEPPSTIRETVHQGSARPQSDPSLTPIKKSSTARSSNISIR